MLPLASTHIIKCECSVTIVLVMLVVMRALASPATTLAVVSTYMNHVKIIASFNFPGIISREGPATILNHVDGSRNEVYSTSETNVILELGIIHLFL